MTSKYTTYPVELNEKPIETNPPTETKSAEELLDLLWRNQKWFEPGLSFEEFTRRLSVTSEHWVTVKHNTLAMLNTFSSFYLEEKEKNPDLTSVLKKHLQQLEADSELLKKLYENTHAWNLDPVWEIEDFKAEIANPNLAWVVVERDTAERWEEDSRNLYDPGG